MKERDAMLVLTRRPGEKLVFGPMPDGTYIEVWVNSIRGDKVRLAVEAPKSVKIIRGELEPKKESKDESVD
jgi:carbon storage regulator CsrA